MCVCLCCVCVLCRNATDGQTSVLLWNPTTGETLASAAVATWWPKTVKATIDPASAFGDYWVREDGVIFYMLFLSNTAQPPSQQLLYYKIYDPERGWIAPERSGKCLITAASDHTWPAMASMAYNPKYGMFIGFTDFSLGTAPTSGGNLGLVSVFINGPQCFQWQLLTYAQGLPAPLAQAGASALHTASNTFAYVGAASGDGDAASVGMVLVDVDGVVNSTLIALPPHSSVTLGALNATAEDFAPRLSAVNIADEAKGDGSAHFLLLQSADTGVAVPESGSDSGRAAPALLHYTAASGFSDRVPESLLPVFPAGPVAQTSARVSTAPDGTYPVLVGVVAAASAQPAFAFMTATPLAPEAWVQVGTPLDAVWRINGQSLPFVPFSAAPAQLKSRAHVRVPAGARSTPVEFDSVAIAPAIALE